MALLNMLVRMDKGDDLSDLDIIKMYKQLSTIVDLLNEDCTVEDDDSHENNQLWRSANEALNRVLAICEDRGIDLSKSPSFCPCCGEVSEIPHHVILNVQTYGGCKLYSMPCCQQLVSVRSKSAIVVHPEPHLDREEDDWGNRVKKG